jgi:hypothetical protein
VKFKLFSLVTALVLFSNYTLAQNAPSAFTKEDSLFFSRPYPFTMPILGQKVHDLGIKLPFPVGVMFNSLVGTQTLSLRDRALGFGRFSNSEGPQMIDVIEIVIFDDVEAQTSTFNLRVDTWVLPFLNVYGIVGQTAKADISVMLREPFPLDVSTEVSGTYLGFGAMIAGAVGPVFVSLDANRTYNWNPRLDDPAKVTLGGIRTGPVFRFKKNRNMNISIWAGAMYSHLDGEMNGNIPALELAPDAPKRIDELQADLEIGITTFHPSRKPYTKICTTGWGMGFPV